MSTIRSAFVDEEGGQDHGGAALAVRDAFADRRPVAVPFHAIEWCRAIAADMAYQCVTFRVTKMVDSCTYEGAVERQRCERLLSREQFPDLAGGLVQLAFIRCEGAHVTVVSIDVREEGRWLRSYAVDERGHFLCQIRGPSCMLIAGIDEGRFVLCRKGGLQCMSTMGIDEIRHRMSRIDGLWCASIMGAGTSCDAPDRIGRLS